MMRRALPKFATALLGTGLALALGNAFADSLAVSDAWVRQPPPGTGVLAGYASLVNRDDSRIVVDAVSSPAFGAIEIHRTVVTDGIARMQPVERLVLEPGQPLDLAPGSYHFMLFRPQGDLAAGQSITLTLHTTDGRCIPFTATLRRSPPGSSD